MKEEILCIINEFYGNDQYCEEMSEEFGALAAYIATHLGDPPEEE